jgi:hypothetical protein
MIGVEWSGRDEDAVREAIFCQRMGLDISGEKYLRVRLGGILNDDLGGLGPGRRR